MLKRSHFISLLLIFSIISSKGYSSSFTWEEKNDRQVEIKKVVKGLATHLIDRVKNTLGDNELTPNIAIAELEIYYNEAPQESPTQVHLPRFFLSGWSRDNYRPRINCDVEDLVSAYIQQKFPHYAHYSISLLRDFFEDQEEFKKFINSLREEGDASEEQFGLKFMHSEQTAFQYIKRNLPEIVRDLGGSNKISLIKARIVSFKPICGEPCQAITTHPIYKKELQDAFSLQKQTFPATELMLEALDNPSHTSSDTSTSSPLGKRPLAESMTSTSTQSSSTQQKRTKREDEGVEKTLSEKTKNVTAEEFEEILSGIQYGNKNADDKFIQALCSRSSCGAMIIRKIGEIKNNLNFLNNEILMKHFHGSQEAIELCGLIRAYIRITQKVETIQGPRSLKGELLKSLGEIKKNSQLAIYKKAADRLESILRGEKK